MEREKGHQLLWAALVKTHQKALPRRKQNTHSHLQPMLPLPRVPERNLGLSHLSRATRCPSLQPRKWTLRGKLSSSKTLRSSSSMMMDTLGLCGCCFSRGLLLVSPDIHQKGAPYFQLSPPHLTSCPGVESAPLPKPHRYPPPPNLAFSTAWVVALSVICAICRPAMAMKAGTSFLCFASWRAKGERTTGGFVWHQRKILSDGPGGGG